MQNKLSIRDLDLRNKRVLIRVDFNVPLSAVGAQITDDSRIRAALPTINYVLDHGGIAVLMSHLGRPTGKYEARYSLKPCAERLAALLKRPVRLAPDCQGEEVKALVLALQPGEVILLENLRFHPGEENPQAEPDFVSALAELGQVYIDDAFGTAHRAHASTVAVTQFFPGRSASGFLMEKEIDYLGRALVEPKRPFYAILGGAKISTKFKLIEILLHKADLLFIGGAMAYTFFKAEGIAVGESLVEDDYLSVARDLMDVRTAARFRGQLMLPTDVVVARASGSEVETHIVPAKEGIPAGFRGVDVGPETISTYIQALQHAATVFWNGPLGIFESPPFDQGTAALARGLADLSQATTIIGGGDSVAAIERMGLASAFTHISTGGGAALEYIEFGHLPGIDALSDAK